MRFLALLTLSAVLTGCCQTRVAQRCCDPQPSCQSACPPKVVCSQPTRSCDVPRCEKQCCDPPRYRTRPKFEIEWKPVKYPVVHVKKVHELCTPPPSRCSTSCCTSYSSHHGQHHGHSDRTPFGDTPVLDPPPVLDPMQPTNEATIPGVEQVPAPKDAAAWNSRGWTTPDGVPSIEDTPPVGRSTFPGTQAYADQRFAVETWPHSPQYSGRR